MDSLPYPQTNLYLRETWLITLSNSIRSNMGESLVYNVNESSWVLYKISKLHRFMALVRMQLQDSLRFLVESSLLCLTQLLLDDCHHVMACCPDMVWGSNLLHCRYK